MCIENLPRTCLGNTPEELLEMIKDIPGEKTPGAGPCAGREACGKERENNMAQTQGQPGPEKDGEGGQPGRVGVGWLKSIYGNKKLSLRVLDTVILLGIAALVVVGFLMMQDRGFTVEFRTDGGSQVASQKLMYGDLVQRPEDPVKEGYTFEGWYWDDEYKLAWNFDTDTVTGDMYCIRCSHVNNDESFSF